MYHWSVISDVDHLLKQNQSMEKLLLQSSLSSQKSLEDETEADDGGIHSHSMTSGKGIFMGGTMLELQSTE